MRSEKTHYILVGGFLGAGKTTAIAALAARLAAEGKIVGLVTNDQSVDLVDTAYLKSAGFHVEEIPGGCFCCRFSELKEASRRLAESASPEYIIAEPVGSCTDLAATVVAPLQHLHGADYRVAPYSVVVDPWTAGEVLGVLRPSAFSSGVQYIYEKQLEEADVILLNKTDTAPAELISAVADRLEASCPEAQILCVSARSGQGLPEWFGLLEEQEGLLRTPMTVDYDVYAEGEARLGWMNATLDVKSTHLFQAEGVLISIATRLQRALAEGAMPIAHLKLSFQPAEDMSAVASVSLPRGAGTPEIGLRLAAPVNAGRLLLNLRAEGTPDRLVAALNHALAEQRRQSPAVTLDPVRLERLSPGRPVPVWRLDEHCNLKAFAPTA